MPTALQRLNVYNLHSPVLPALPPYSPMPQIGLLQPEVQSGMFLARPRVRVQARDPKRVGEVLDTLTRTGATIVSPLSVRAADEAGARKAALEAAGKDARGKAETLAAAVGKQVGDVVAVAEEVIVSNGAYNALRSAMPFAFGTGTPPAAGELEYYARVSATFRLQ